ncbi:MAG: hypothetical protein SFU86_17450 [Pirellulaceae bacterium]|nr:hypothetical protein [Pirellulaceae bacterium]
MKTQVLWQSNVITSGLHAARGLAAGRSLADLRLAPFEDASQHFQGAIQSAGLPAARFWRHLLGLSTTNSGRALFEAAVLKTSGRRDGHVQTVDQLWSAAGHFLAAYRDALPNLADELALRERPLREQWEARGPGLLATFARLTDEQLLPPQATVILVHPAFGGGGEAHLPYNSVRVEAVLANPHADLPEVVRLGWLIAQLQLDLPDLSESIHADRLPHVARFAVLPAILQAAEEVELVRYSPELVRRAIDAWQLSAPSDLDAAALVVDWWLTWQQDRPAPAVALAALDQMFG